MVGRDSLGFMRGEAYGSGFIDRGLESTRINDFDTREGFKREGLRGTITEAGGKKTRRQRRRGLVDKDEWMEDW